MQIYTGCKSRKIYETRKIRVYKKIIKDILAAVDE